MDRQTKTIVLEVSGPWASVMRSARALTSDVVVAPYRQVGPLDSCSNPDQTQALSSLA